MSMKNFSDTTENRTRDLPSCSLVPQQTALPRDTISLICTLNNLHTATIFYRRESKPFLIYLLYLKMVKECFSVKQGVFKYFIICIESDNILLPPFIIQGDPLAKEHGISLIKILQRILNSSTFFSFTFLTQ
jgi:hypothetical protein